MFKLSLSLILFLLFFSCSGKPELPNIKVRDIEGREFSLRSLKGHPVLLYVWSRTCAGHAKDLRSLNEFAEKYPSYWIVSYAVAMEPKDVKKTYKELGIEPKFLTLVDTAISFNSYYSLIYLPSSYIFDKDGKFKGSFYGLPDSLENI